MKNQLLLAGAALMPALSTPSLAHENDLSASHAMDHAPIGVMADHRHDKGESMLSYRFMTMDMKGSRIDTIPLTPDQIATIVANPFFGAAGQPPTLRVVPTQMTMNMHMVGGMYGLSDRITLMGMTNILTNDMDHTTYISGMGTNVLGKFTTKSSGFGDCTVSAIIGLDDGDTKNKQINLNLGLSLPTGSRSETDQILTPMGSTPTHDCPIRCSSARAHGISDPL